MSAPAYGSYKESGVKWLGKLPSHWRIAPFWSLYRRTKRTGFPDADLLSIYRDYGVIRKSDRDDNFNNPSDDLSTYQLVEPGDLAMNKMKAWQGSLGVSAHRGIVSPAYFVFQAHHVESRQFLHRLLRSSGYAVGFMSISKGIRIGQWDIDPDHLRRVPVPLPSLSEQAAIAAFLDREIGKIDALVEAQTRLIELLKEKRQAVISHAVTKGLDPAVPMKASGVEWLGQVPAHWEVRPIRKLAKLESGHTPSRSKPEYWQDCTVPWFTLADVWQIREAKRDRVFETKEMVSELGLANSSARLLPEGTVMLSRTASVGFSAIMGVPMATTQDFANWICGPKLLPDFLLLCLRAMGGEFRRLMMGSTHNTIYMPDIEALTVAAPPINEQVAIVRQTGERAARFEALIVEAQGAVALLTERRAALISAAVTGKIDVRGLVPAQAEAA